jgi:hypothetical protein
LSFVTRRLPVSREAKIRRKQTDCKPRLAALHQTLQAALGWSDTHLHGVRIQARDFGSLGQDPGAVRLSDFRLRPRETFSYVYNFTDNWEWQVRLLEVMPAEEGRWYPVCVGGRRAAPPEDCGGPQAYLRKLDEHHLPLDALGVLAHGSSHGRNWREREGLRGSETTCSPPTSTVPSLMVLAS